MEGMGRGNLAAYNAESLKQLHSFLEENDIRDGDKWLAKFMRVNKMLGKLDIHLLQRPKTKPDCQ
jgi:hypothetical protein